MFMRQFLIFSLILTSVITSNCGKNARNSRTDSLKAQGQNKNVEIVFKEYEHSFGKVTAGEKVACSFTFENRGTDDLIVTSVTTSCGCTVPKYDSKPIPAGGTGNLEVVFDTSGRSGIQTKTITVKSNASVPVVLLKITAEVVNTINN
jgi:hypothetical protein